MPAEDSDVAIILESSDADTYLYLRPREATSGDFLLENDDHEDSTQRPRIPENLEVGTYTIEPPLTPPML